ncbi:hypothetical protein C2S53_005001 [Perilla frutescens var. hirtella]|uniref:Uncharacterized protein n=1 Tax=Perilla frutescens var. hirtella TaxID=608512 RepID=A0AAD4JFU6_PERFH|nr:hypothetical protein C2S53_005001 [Perilla frutescens var. hirtella]
MMHQQRNGNYSGLQLQPRPNGSQQHIINASHVNAAQLGREAMQQQQLNLQSYAGTPTSHFSSSSNFPESTSPMGDQA